VLFLESMTSIPSLFHAIDASDDEDSLHSCLAAGSECCHCASASRLGFWDHDRDASWVSRRVQFLSCYWPRLLSLRFSQRVCDSWITTGTCHGSRVESSSCLGAGSDCCPRCAVLVLLQAQTAVAALWTAFCDSWIMTRTRAGSHVESSSCLATGPDCCRCALDSML
jgi:hypothetical protein